ncbi:MBG domain-containing protein [Pedobacter sp. L105]|uniref:MBG domain-containing protein n=1 Tax=Pedobacter sp. L105 TaxID=1641871 RepID=UPI00131B726D|nr:MBG domain-containing protein [Pedobacter sp. L105]
MRLKFYLILPFLFLYGLAFGQTITYSDDFTGGNITLTKDVVSTGGGNSYSGGGYIIFWCSSVNLGDSGGGLHTGGTWVLGEVNTITCNDGGQAFYYNVSTNSTTPPTSVHGGGGWQVMNGSTPGALNLTVAGGITAPTATTVAASSILSTSAILNGSLNANGATTTATFEYSTTSATLSSGVTSVAASPASVAGGAGNTNVTYNLSTTGATTYYYRVKGVNSSGTTTGSILSFTTPAPIIVIAPATLPAPTTGVAYSSTLTSSGGIAPYTFAISAGALPAGLILTPSGVLSGIPTAGGTFNFTVTTTDASSSTGTRVYSFTVSAPTIAVTPVTLPAATAGTAYSQTITASGGTAPYTFAITSGTLPTGLTLSPAGVLSGTTTLSGTFNITVRATDNSTGTGPYFGSRSYSLTVNGPTITSGGGPLTTMSATYGTASAPAQSFTVSGANLTAGLVITPPNIAFEISKDNGTTYSSTLSLTPPVSGTVTTTTILVRLAATATVGSHSGNIVLSSSGATAVNVPTTSSTVLPAPLTITANSQTKVYGAALPTLTASYTGFVNGDNPASLTTLATLTTTASAASSVAGSPYAITASGAVDPNYTISYVAGSLSVTSAPLTITANNQTKVYGAALPTLTASYNGFVNGDTQASLTTLATLATTASAASSVAGSPYAITASGAVDPNYTISYVPGNLSVTPAPLTITANNQTKIYGAALPTLTASYSGFVNGDTQASLTTQPTLTTTATATSSVSGSPYPITASGAVSPNYTITYTPGNLSVTTAALTITADNQTKAYGAAVPTLTASYNGFVNGDTQASLTTQPTLTTTATGTSSVAGSPYPITASGAVNSNYTITYTPGNLSVTAATLTITADNQTKTYGAAVPTLTASYSGFVNGDTQASLTTQPTLTTTATATSSVAGSPYPITASGAVSTNYTITYTPGNLSVTAATLNITADNQTKTYGAAVPALTASYSGFVNGDTQASLTTQPTLTTTATVTSSVAGSPYAITASGAVDPNYTISYVPGNLSVTSAPLTITANSQTKVYGEALPTLTASYTGFVNGDTQASLTTLPTLTTTATATSSVTGSPYPITASGAVDLNYTISYVAGNLSVSAAALTITADNQTKGYGAALPALTASYSGFVNGDTQASLTTQPTLTTTATPTSSVAGSPYTITASGAVSPNYTITYTHGNLSVTTAALTITADNQTKTYGAAVPTLTASYSGFVNGDTQASLTTQPTLTTTATATSSVSGSPYPITASGAVSPNYTITYTPGNLSVTTAALTITADNQTKTYGAAVPTLTASYSGFVSGDTQASLTTQPTLTTTATATSSVAGSPYPITASGAVSPNYTITYTPGNLSVTTAALTITADNQTKIYGAAVPTLTASYSGFVNGDTQASLTTQPTLTTNATPTSSVAGSPYAITASGAVSSNYTVTYTPGNLSVTTATLTITADNQTKTYGAAVPTLTASYSGFVNGDTQASLTTQPTLTTTATPTSSVAGSPYPITVSGAADPNYNISYTAGNLSVSTSAITVTADEKSKTYGDADPALTYVITSGALASADTFTGTLTRTAGENVNTYAITQGSLALNSNYVLTYAGANLSIVKRALTITADNKTKIQGTANPPLTASYSGFVNGDTNDQLTTQPNLSTTAVLSSSANTYPITVNGAASTNYTINYVPGILTVTGSVLTVTVNNQSKVYGSTNPDLTVSYSGFINGDSEASFTTKPVVSTTATTGSAAGVYPVTVSGGSIAGYNLVYVPGSLTVTPAALTITADNKSRIYGTDNPELTLTYSGFVNGDDVTKLSSQAVATTAAVSTTAPGNYPIMVNGASSSDYTFNYVNGTLNITPLTVNSVSGLTISSGTLSPSFTAATHGYTASVDNTVSNITLKLTFDPTATAKIDGSPVTNSDPLATVSLNVGNNTILVVVTAQDGVTKNTYTLTIYRGEAAASVTATNILTPNGDGKNDTWVIQDIQLYPKNSVKVFDRAGRTVYAKNGYMNDWDGTLRGAPLAEGTYYYTVDLGPGLTKFNGFITLLRSK